MRIMENTGVEPGTTKRRARTKQERRRVVEETFAAGVSVADVARAHGVRPNQVFHWRRLYHKGLLGNGTETTALVPVRITEAAEQRPVHATPAAQARRGVGKSAYGTIQIELERARICIQGGVDPASLRVVLESLLG
jgi:transposase